MTAKHAMLTMAVATLLFVLSSAGQVIVSNKPKDGKATAVLKIWTGPAQRCYSFTHFGHDVTLAEWADLQEHALLVFFAEPGCKGYYLMAFAGDDFQMKFYGTKLEKHISSIMLWESSVYTTRGIVDYPVDAEFSAYHYESYHRGGSEASSENDTSVVGVDDSEQVVGVVYAYGDYDLTR